MDVAPWGPLSSQLCAPRKPRSMSALKGWDRKPREALPLPRDTPCLASSDPVADSKFLTLRASESLPGSRMTAVSFTPTGHRGLQAQDRAPGRCAVDWGGVPVGHPRRCWSTHKPGRLGCGRPRCVGWGRGGDETSGRSGAENPGLSPRLSCPPSLHPPPSAPHLPLSTQDPRRHSHPDSPNHHQQARIFRPALCSSRSAFACRGSAGHGALPSPALSCHLSPGT